MRLLEAWRGGDEQAGQQLFARHFESVYRFFCNKVMGDVDDLVQETFLGCVRSKETFRADASFRTFLFAVAHRQLMKYRANWYRDRDRAADFEVSRADALDRTPSQFIVEHQEQALLLRALRRLPLPMQVVLELFYWEEMRSEDIATILEIPHGTARSRLRRAREQLRDKLQELAERPSLLQSTLGDFEGWMRSVQRKRPSTSSQRF